MIRKTVLNELKHHRYELLVCVSRSLPCPQVSCVQALRISVSAVPDEKCCATKPYAASIDFVHTLAHPRYLQIMR